MNQPEYRDLTLDIINEQTAMDAESYLKEKEEYVDRKLIPEIRKELAVKEAQEIQLEKIESEINVMNLASEFTLRIKGGEYEKAYQCFALKTKGVSAEITNAGVYEGADAIRSYFVDYYTKSASDAGYFKIDHLCTPVVEVADDNQTAKGMWLSIGMEALKRPDLPSEYTDPLCIWAFATWAIDFVKEDGVWKIWHLTIFDEIRTTYEKSWSEMAFAPLPEDPQIPTPTCKSEKHHPFALDRKPYLHQEPPVPYAQYQN